MTAFAAAHPAGFRCRHRRGSRSDHGGGHGQAGHAAGIRGNNDSFLQQGYDMLAPGRVAGQAPRGLAVDRTGLGGGPTARRTTGASTICPRSPI